MEGIAAIVIGVIVAGAVAFVVFGNLRPARTEQLPDRHKRDD